MKKKIIVEIHVITLKCEYLCPYARSILQTYLYLHVWLSHSIWNKCTRFPSFCTQAIVAHMNLVWNRHTFYLYILHEKETKITSKTNYTSLFFQHKKPHEEARLIIVWYVVMHTHYLRLHHILHLMIKIISWWLYIL